MGGELNKVETTASKDTASKKLPRPAHHNSKINQLNFEPVEIFVTV
jgi:hypothetical protein